MCLYAAVVISAPTPDAIVGGQHIPSSDLCQLVSSLPTWTSKWAHYTVPITSGHIHHVNTEGVPEHLTQVEQTYRLNNKEPHRHYKATYRGNNVFTMFEGWAYDTNGPTLSQTYYTITSTDDNGLNPGPYMIISMPPRSGSDPKFCEIDFVNDANHRTFTLNMHVELLKDKNGKYY